MKKNKMFIICGVVTCLIFIVIVFLLLNNKISSFDTSIYNFIYNFINDNNTLFFKVITFLGNAYFLIPFSLFLATLLWIRRHVIYGLILIITLESSHLLVTLLKEIFQRERPSILRLVTENSYSFPSSHSLVSICFYGFLIFVIGTLIKGKFKYVLQGLLGLIILTIGISRIYLGVHYASDVLAGFSIGFTWLVVCILITKKIKL